MRYQLTGHVSAVESVKPAPPATADGVPTPASGSGLAPVVPLGIDLATLSPAQLPAQVTLKTTAEVTDASGLKMKIDPGNRVRLLRVENGWAVISPGTSPFEGRVPVSGTDLMEQLAANPPSAALPAVAVIDPAPIPVPVPAPTPEPVSPVAQVNPPPTGDSLEPGDVVTPPTPPIMPDEPAPGPPPAPTAAVDVVGLMKAHVSGGNIKEFTFNQVQGWRAEQDEVIDGETYQIGLIRYTAETIFGTKSIEAKALIKDGVLVKWIWPKSSMEIK
ncbi:MAG: hypothetical protein K9N23_12940 [Akkermansiaceae bacterium]|nr:hypothetical protein [Akkermansiaceae bacterium]MCF7732591.1 hypothetical protein [Akkermansiaceae bacterium]